MPSAIVGGPSVASKPEYVCHREPEHLEFPKVPPFGSYILETFAHADEGADGHIFALMCIDELQIYTDLTTLKTLVREIGSDDFDRVTVPPWVNWSTMPEKTLAVDVMRLAREIEFFLA